jgi:hypothetical protein
VSEWELSIPPDTNHFDFNSISDVIVKISYTALEDTGTLANDVKKILYAQSAPYPFGVSKQFILQQAFAAAWYQFMNPQPDPVSQQINFQLTDAIILPNLKDVTLLSARVFILTKNNTVISDKETGSFLILKQEGIADIPLPVNKNVGTASLTGTVKAEKASLAFTIAHTPDALLTADKKQLDPEKLTGLVFILNYTSNVFGN